MVPDCLQPRRPTRSWRGFAAFRLSLGAGSRQWKVRCCLVCSWQIFVPVLTCSHAQVCCARGWTTNGTRHPLICAEFNERASGRKFLDDGLCFTHAVRHVLRSHSHRQPRSSVNKCPAPTRCETCAPYAQQRDPRNSHLLRPHPPQATVNPPQAGAYRRHGDNQRAIPSPRCQSPCRTVAAVRVAASASTRTACQSG